MSIPPDQVPDGLSASEYQRLVALYTLMGRHQMAHEALTHYAQTERAEHGEPPLEPSPGPESEAGASFAQALMGVLQALNKKDERDIEDGRQLGGAEHGEGGDDAPDTDDANDFTDELAELRHELLGLGLSDKEADDYLDKLQSTWKEVSNQSVPSRDVPDDLTPKEYWELALRYKQVGWTEQSRDALNLAIELDPDGEWGRKAICFLRSKIPRHPVPLMAEQLNIQGYNLMFSDEDAAIETFAALVANYPTFEWPYGNLGSLLIKKGNLLEAEKLLDIAVDINPYYINGWLHLARVYAIESRFDEADACLARVKDIDPSDPNWQGIQDLIEQIKTK